MGDSTEGFREALDFTSCHSLQTRRHDRTNGKRAELAGKYNVPDVSHGNYKSTALIILSDTYDS